MAGVKVIYRQRRARSGWPRQFGVDQRGMSVPDAQHQPAEQSAVDPDVLVAPVAAAPPRPHSAPASALADDEFDFGLVMDAEKPAAAVDDFGESGEIPPSYSDDPERFRQLYIGDGTVDDADRAAVGEGDFDPFNLYRVRANRRRRWYERARLVSDRAWSENSPDVYTEALAEIDALLKDMLQHRAMDWDYQSGKAPAIEHWSRIEDSILSIRRHCEYGAEGGPWTRLTPEHRDIRHAMLDAMRAAPPGLCRMSKTRKGVPIFIEGSPAAQINREGPALSWRLDIATQQMEAAGLVWRHPSPAAPHAEGPAPTPAEADAPGTTSRPPVASASVAETPSSGGDGARRYEPCGIPWLDAIPMPDDPPRHFRAKRPRRA